MDFEGVQIIETSIAKITKRMVEDNFTSCTALTFFQVALEFVVGVETLFTDDAASVV